MKIKFIILVLVSLLSTGNFISNALAYNYNYGVSNGYGETSKETGRVRDQYVDGYTKKNGTHVDGYYRSKRQKK